MRNFGVTILSLALIALPACAREGAGAEQGTAADEAAIRDLPVRYAEFINKHDAAGLGSLFADDYEEVDPTGKHTVGHDALMTAQAEMLKGMPEGFQVSATSDYIKWLEEDAAVTGGTYHGTGGPPGMPTQGAWMAVVVKRDGAWKMLASLGGDDVTPMMASDTGSVKRQ